MTEISNNSQNSSNISNEPANKIMRVLKRDGTDEEVSFDKIIRRVKNSTIKTYMENQLL